MEHMKKGLKDRLTFLKIEMERIKNDIKSLIRSQELKTQELDKFTKESEEIIEFLK